MAKPRSLLQEIMWTVVIKLVALSIIWWCFIRDVKVEVATTDTAQHLLASPSSSAQQRSTHHD